MEGHKRCHLLSRYPKEVLYSMEGFVIVRQKTDHYTKGLHKSKDKTGGLVLGLIYILFERCPSVPEDSPFTHSGRHFLLWVVVDNLRSLEYDLSSPLELCQCFDRLVWQSGLFENKLLNRVYHLPSLFLNFLLKTLIKTIVLRMLFCGESLVLR